jgi:hypothetical protein
MRDVEHHEACDPRSMTVYPDGEALSDWEREIIEDFEHDFGLGAASRAAERFGADPAALYAVTASMLVAEGAVAVATLTASMAGVLARLATIGPWIWMTSIRTTQGLRATPDRVHRVPQ